MKVSTDSIEDSMNSVVDSYSCEDETTEVSQDVISIEDPVSDLNTQKKFRFTYYADSVKDVLNAPLEVNSLSKEYELFKKEPIAKFFENPLEYWKCSNFAKLKNIARSIYCIPVSSAEPERHNSAAGNTVTAVRNKLSPETVENLVIYNEFLKNR